MSATLNTDSIDMPVKKLEIAPKILAKVVDSMDRLILATTFGEMGVKKLLFSSKNHPSCHYKFNNKCCHTSDPSRLHIIF